ncbi:DUF1566 domain-containing protein [Deltaproteobacteria bacterium TL4]
MKKLILLGWLGLLVIGGCTEKIDESLPGKDIGSPSIASFSVLSDDLTQGLIDFAISASDDRRVDAYYLSENNTAPSASSEGWVSVPPVSSYSGTITYSFQSDGDKTLYVWVRDRIGNLSASASTTLLLLLDITPPTNAAISSWNASYDASTDTVSISLEVSATDNFGISAYYVSELSAVPIAKDAGWISLSSSTRDYSGTLPFTLSSGIGEKKVYVWFKDAAENSSSGVSTTITIERLDFGNGTILDKTTGLMWQKADDGTQRNWDAANQYCDTLALADYADWYLPTKDELMGLVDTQYNPTIDPAFFPNTKSSYYWSSTTGAYGTSGAWYVDFLFGHVGGNSKTSTYYVRCVRTR